MYCLKIKIEKIAGNENPLIERLQNWMPKRWKKSCFYAIYNVQIYKEQNKST